MYDIFMLKSRRLGFEYTIYESVWVYKVHINLKADIALLMNPKYCPNPASGATKKFQHLFLSPALKNTNTKKMWEELVFIYIGCNLSKFTNGNVGKWNSYCSSSMRGVMTPWIRTDKRALHSNRCHFTKEFN